MAAVRRPFEPDPGLGEFGEHRLGGDLRPELVQRRGRNWQAFRRRNDVHADAGDDFRPPAFERDGLEEDARDLRAVIGDELVRPFEGKAHPWTGGAVDGHVDGKVRAVLDNASWRARPATKPSVAARDGTAFVTTNTLAARFPEGVAHGRPRRPLPAVCCSAANQTPPELPPRAAASASSLVEPTVS